MQLSMEPIRVLVVEDNPGDFLLLKECLLETSLQIGSLTCAATLAEAQALASENRYDIVFLDLSLPDGTASDTFERIRPHLHETPVIVLSGMNDRELVLRLIHEGAQDYLLKDNLDVDSLDKAIYYSIERMRHTVKLLESTARLHFQSTVLSNITDSVIVTNMNKQVVYWNKAATEIYGYTEEEMLCQNMGMMVVDPHDGTDPKSIIERLAKDGMMRAVVRRRTKNGHIIWVEIKITYNYDVDHNISGLIGVSKDVTDIKAEEHLLTLFQSVILNANDAVIITEASAPEGLPARRIVFVNRAFTQMTGYTPEETIGNNLFQLAGPLTDEHEVKRVRDAMDRWERIECELAYYRKDGVAFWVSLNITPVSDHSGNFTHWVFIQRDITESRRAAEMLRQQNEELIKTNRELDRFVYSASHDLRAPLTSVLGLVSLMRKEHFSASAAIYLDKIHESVQRLDRLIQNIINYSRNSRLKPLLKPIDFRELFDATISMHRFMDNSRPVRFEFVNLVERPFYSDPERWQIIFNNLVSNSIKFSRPGTACAITLRLRDEDQSLAFVFEDNGIGIQPEQLGSVFEMFYRATDTLPGSGLGLYIVKQTVELLGGTIGIESGIGHFTRFTIRMPFPVSAPDYAEKSS